MKTLPEYKGSDFGRVAVLFGGQSAERAISLESGAAIHTALCNAGVDAYTIDVDKNTVSRLINDEVDRVFIALHGQGGEDGTIQGALELLGLPYTGSKVLGSTLAMDKFRSKAIWRGAGLSTPDAVELSQHNKWDAIIDQLGLPIMVKPVNEGSSIGASKVTEAVDLPTAWLQASQFSERIMAESWIEGGEYTVSIINDLVLPAIKLETTRDFYDYQAKYEDKNTKYICPCGLDVEFEKWLGDISLEACRLLDVSGWARVDFMIDEEIGKAWLIEVNTVPGMTRHSLVPMAAKQFRLTFEQLTIQILGTSMVAPKSRGLQNK